MEGGFEAHRDSARPTPIHAPPVEPGSGPPLQTLALVARILRGRELAADAAGIPPLDPDQVLDLQRSAGNALTSHALARWTGPATEAGLLEQLLAARDTDPAHHATLATAIDALEVLLRVRLSRLDGPAEEIAVEVRGPAGGASFGTATLSGTVVALADLPFAVAFGPAATVAPGHGLIVRLAAAGTEPVTAVITVPFAQGARIVLGGATYVALVEALRA
jgi:hypothetical protein